LLGADAGREPLLLLTAVSAVHLVGEALRRLLEVLDQESAAVAAASVKALLPVHAAAANDSDVSDGERRGSAVAASYSL
jgi:hypothetical protein